MKKLISLFLTMAMLLTLAPSSVFANESETALGTEESVLVDEDEQALETEEGEATEEGEEKTFTDVEGEEYYAKSVEILAALGILSGYEDGSFGAAKTITRAEMATVICKMLGLDEEAQNAKGETKFDDVPAGHWASGYINVASEKGIVSGDGDGSFRPDDPVKYEEALTMIINALGWAEDITADPNDWSKAYLELAGKMKLNDNLQGKKGEDATRGDVAVMTYNGMRLSIGVPVPSVEEGKYSSSQTVALTTTTEGAKIYYTTDGSIPSVKSAEYKEAIKITKTTELKAIAVVDDLLISDLLSVKYTISRGGGGGGISGGGSSTPVLSAASILVNGQTVAAGTELKAGETLTIATVAAGVTGHTIVWNVGGTEVTNTSYTVTKLDAGKTISATVTKDATTVTTAAYTVENKTAVDIGGTVPNDGTAPDSPAVIGDPSDYYTIPDTPSPTPQTYDMAAAVAAEADIEFSLNVNPYDYTADADGVATTVGGKVVDTVNTDFGTDFAGTGLENVFDFAKAETKLIVTVGENPADDVYSVGDFTLTLSAEMLGIELAEGEKLSDYYVVAYHKNIMETEETVKAVYVTDASNAEYAQLALNGMGDIYIAYRAPSTVSFNDGTNTVNYKVPYGGTFNETVANPTRENAIFNGWNNAPAASDKIFDDVTVTANWVCINLHENYAGSWSDIDFDGTGVQLDAQDGYLKITATEATYPASVSYFVDVTAISGAREYAVADTAEAAYEATELTDVTGAVQFIIPFTGEDGAPIASETTKYIKWVDENGVILEISKLTIEVDDGQGFAESRERNFWVDRGLAKYAAYLVDTDGEPAKENFAASINVGATRSYSQNLGIIFYLDGNAQFSMGHINNDMTGYDTVKYVFTAFENENFEETDLEGAAVTADLWVNGTSYQDYQLTGALSVEAGKLIANIPLTNVVLTDVSNAGMDITLTFGGKAYEFYAYINRGGSPRDKAELETADWNEVVTCLNGGTPTQITYTGGDVTVTNTVTVPNDYAVYMSNASLTIANGGAVILGGSNSDNYYDAELDTENLTVENGGKLAINTVSSNYYSNSGYVNARTAATFEQGAIVDVCNNGYLSVYGNTVSFETGVAVTNNGNFNINGQSVSVDTTIATGSEYSNVNIQAYDNGEVVIGENGSVTVNGTSQQSYIGGKLVNKGTINVNGASGLYIDNAGYSAENKGTVNVASGAVLTVSGTKLINSGIVTGAGTVDGKLGINTHNYDDGTDYFWQQEHVDTPSEYNYRWYFADDRDPAEVISATVYKGEIVNEGAGTVATTVSVTAESFPAAG